jgi:alkaline phosphatase
VDELQITAARNYELGSDGRFALDTLRYTGHKTTYSVTEDGSPDYTPESASTATVWSTDFATTDGRSRPSPAPARACTRRSSSSPRTGASERGT